MGQLLTTELLVNLMTPNKPRPLSLNADYAWHLDNHAAAAVAMARDSWLLRLLPEALRAPIRARLAATEHERTLIRLWNISPHLITDIGVTFGPTTGEADHLVIAPAGLVAHVKAFGMLPTEPRMQPHPNLPPPCARGTCQDQSGSPLYRANPNRVLTATPQPSCPFFNGPLRRTSHDAALSRPNTARRTAAGSGFCFPRPSSPNTICRLSKRC